MILKSNHNIYEHSQNERQTFSGHNLVLLNFPLLKYLPYYLFIKDTQLKSLYIPQLDFVSILDPKPELNPPLEAELVPAPHPRLAELLVL